MKLCGYVVIGSLRRQSEVVDDRHGRHFRRAVFDVREQTSEQSLRVVCRHQLAPTQLALGECEQQLRDALLDGRGAGHGRVEELAQFVADVAQTEELQLVLVCQVQ